MKRDQIKTLCKSVVLPLPDNEKVKLLTGHELRLYNLLSRGGQYSTIEIMQKLLIADPRKTINRIRNKGITVSDVWCIGMYNARFKRYFIHKSE